MRECELCDLPARMYCESDEASLCWDCDSKVHSANFLVARHSRSLLCHVCQSSTPWKASGEKLGRTAAICESCVGNCHGSSENNIEDEEEEYADQEEDVDQEDEEEKEEEEDNQVVPGVSTPPPPAENSSTSEEEEESSYCGSEDLDEIDLTLSSKRRRLNQNEDGCSSSFAVRSESNMIRAADDNATPTTSFRFAKPSKEGKKESLPTQTFQSEFSPIQLADSLRRFEQDILSGKATSSSILEICTLKKASDSRTVDFLSTSFL